MWDQIGETLNQATVRVLSRLASLLPGAIAFTIAVLFSIAVAWVVVAILRRSLRTIQFDKKLELWGFSGLAELSPQQSPTLLVTRVAGCLIVVIGFVLGLGAFDATLTADLEMRLFDYLRHILMAIVVLLVGGLIARYLARTVLIESVNANLQYARLLSIGTKWLVMVLTIAMALDDLEIGSGIVHLAFGILFGGIVLALALAVGLGSKELVSRSLERESSKAAALETEEHFRHI